MFHQYRPENTIKMSLTSTGIETDDLSIIAGSDNRVSIRDAAIQFRVPRAQQQCAKPRRRAVTIRKSGVIRLNFKTGGGDDRMKVDFRYRAGEVAGSFFDLGAGDDTIELSARSPRGKGPAALSYRAVINGGAGNDLLKVTSRARSIDEFMQGSYRVQVNGGSGDDVLVGGPRIDFLSGGVGNDSLEGGAGDDNLTGSAGDDQIYAGGGRDFVDCGSGKDTVFLQGSQLADQRSCESIQP